MKTTVTSVPDRIMRRARAGGRGGVFTPSDFLDVAARSAVDQALSRLVKNGKLRRLACGLYDFPKVHPKLGPLSPELPDDVAQALARETGSRVQIAGARAANALGLSTQVPARSTYLTDGPSRRVVLGKRVVDLRHASPKHLIARAVRPAPSSRRFVMSGRCVPPTLHGSRRVVCRPATRRRSHPLPSKRLLGCGRRSSRSPTQRRPTSMDKVALLPVDDRAALFGETGAAEGWPIRSSKRTFGSAGP